MLNYNQKESLKLSSYISVADAEKLFESGALKKDEYLKFLYYKTELIKELNKHIEYVFPEETKVFEDAKESIKAYK